MDTELTKIFGAANLERALKVLRHSHVVRSKLVSFFGQQRGEEAIRQLDCGTLSGDLGDHLRDFLEDEITNESISVWCGTIFDPDDEEDVDRHYPVTVNEYEGLFWVSALESDPIGYFLTKDEAVNCAFMNWENIKPDRD